MYEPRRHRPGLDSNPGLCGRARDRFDRKWFVPASERPRISAEFLETERATVGAWVFSQEYEGQFLDSGGQIFSSQHIEASILDRPWLPLLLTNAVKPRGSVPAAPITPGALAAPDDLGLEGEASGYVVGLDIGQARDHTAVCVIEQRIATEVETVPGSRNPFHPEIFLPDRQREKATVHGHIVFLARFILGTPYPDVVEDIVHLLEQLPPLWGETDPPALWVDATGVGRGLLDMFADRGVKPRGATLTGGHDVTINSLRDVRIPKTRLISGVQLALQTGRLKVAAGIPALPQFISEMEGFTAKISSTGAVATEAFSQGVHDDLVIAAALGLWGWEHPLRAPKLVML